MIYLVLLNYLLCMPKKLRRTFTLDADVFESVRLLADKYDVNISDYFNDALFELLQQLRGVEALSQQHPDGVPLDAARHYVNRLVKGAVGDMNALAQEMFPEPPQPAQETSRKSSKAKA